MAHNESMFGVDRSDPQQLLADDLVNQMQDLLAELVALRKAKHLSQAEVADVIGVTRTAVTHFERYDSDPKLSTIIRYALAVGARISLDVEDGVQWAQREILRENVSHVVETSTFDSFVSERETDQRLVDSYLGRL